MHAVFFPLRGFTGLNVTFILNLILFYVPLWLLCITFVLSKHAVAKYSIVLFCMPAQSLGIFF